MNVLRKIGIGLLSGLIGGLVWGIGARIAMRIVVLAAHGRPEFSIGGTLGILMVGAVFGLPLGLIVAGTRRFLPDSRLRSGLMYGLLMLLLPGWPIHSGFIMGESDLGVRVLAVAMFGALFVGFGMVVALAYTWLDRRLEMRYSGARVKALTS